MPESNSKGPASTDSVLSPITYVAGRTTLWNQSWLDVYKKLGDVIIMYARQEGLNEHSAKDVLQEVMVTVLRSKRGEVAGHDPAKGSFRAWLKGVVHNRIRTLRRKDQKEKPMAPATGGTDEEPGQELPDIPQPPPDFEEMDEREWQLAIFGAALQRVRARVSADNFAIYMALLEETGTPEQLAGQYGKKTNNIYRIKNSCKTMVEEEAKAIREAWGELRQVPT